jgi:iron complex transport system permease protein
VRAATPDGASVGIYRSAVDRRRGSIRRTLGLLVALGLLVWVVLMSVRIGSVPIESGTVLDAFFGFDGSDEHLIVRSLRVPRTLIGLGVGAALAVAGAVTQGVTRNPLGAPDILGINAGASFAVVTAIHVLGFVSPRGYVWFAFAGALCASIVVYVLGSAGSGGPTPVKLALSGAVLTALLGSWTTALVVLDQRTLDEARFWLAGSIAGRELSVFVRVLPFLLAGLAISLVLGRQLNALGLGEDLARGLGQRTGWVKVACATAVVLLAGSAVAAAGPIAFVALATPHMVRSLVGPDYRWLLPYSMLLGPVLLLSADILGRILMRPAELQVGIVTAVFGAPVLIHLVRSSKGMET